MRLLQGVRLNKAETRKCLAHVDKVSILWHGPHITSMTITPGSLGPTAGPFTALCICMRSRGNLVNVNTLLLKNKDMQGSREQQPHYMQSSHGHWSL